MWCQGEHRFVRELRKRRRRFGGRSLRTNRGSRFRRAIPAIALSAFVSEVLKNFPIIFPHARVDRREALRSFGAENVFRTPFCHFGPFPFPPLIIDRSE